jgi:hypothetical protein
VEHSTRYWKRYKKIEEKKIELNDKEQLHGTEKVPVIFQEMDGLWLKIQGKNKE